jgi:hypothetical protein
MMSSLELDRCNHAERRVTALAVVEDLEVLGDRVCELDVCSPAPLVEKLELHPVPERLDDSVVVAIAH